MGLAKWPVWIAALLGAVLVLSGCSQIDDTPSYRYRLTVEVDTPEGIKSGFSVIEVDSTVETTPMDLSEVLRSKARGEAVAVDLPSGDTMFALLRSETNVQWAAYTMIAQIPKIEGSGMERQIAELQSIQSYREEYTLPRTYPKNGPVEEHSAYPMLVTFGDLDDPTSVAEVDPDDLNGSFGEGYALKRITVQVTDEAVTTGIEKRLGWLRTAEGAISKIPMSERPPVGTPLPLHATLPETSFRIGTKR